MAFDFPQSNHFLGSLVPSTLFLLVGPSKYDDVLYRITSSCSMVSLQEHIQHALIESIHRTPSYLVHCRTWSKCSVILWIIEVWNWIRRPYIVGVEGQRAFGGTPKHDVCVCVCWFAMNEWIVLNWFFANTSWAISTDYNLKFKEVSHAIKCINKCNGQRHCRSILFLEAFKATHARCDDAKVLQCEQCLWRVTWRLLKGELHGFALTIPYHCDSLYNVYSFLMTVYNNFESII